MQPMTSRERHLAALRREPTDRCPVRLWGVSRLAKYEEPTYQFLQDLLVEYGLDDVHSAHDMTGGARWMGMYAPGAPVEEHDEPSRHEGFKERHYVCRTPRGDLHRVYLESLHSKPGYQQECWLKTVEDCEKWLSIADVDYEIDPAGYYRADEEIGEHGVVMIGLPEAMYQVNDAMGSEFFALMSVEERDLLHEMIAQAARRIETYVERVLGAGLTGLFGYVGPELCIPPLMGPRDFDDFCTRYDAPLIQRIHEAGGLVWVHCHGDMRPVLERFADEQHVDCLNPMEPPPLGIELAEAKRRVGDRMTLEGNLEIALFELCTPQEVRRLTLEALEAGMPGGGFILCPTSSHTHWPVLSDRIMANYRTFVETAAENWGY